MSTRSAPSAALTSAISTAVELGHRRGGVARDPRAVAQPLQRELLGLRRAQHAQGVEPELPVDPVRVAGGGLDRAVVAGAERDRVLAAPGLTRSASSPVSITSAALLALTTSAPAPVSILSSGAAADWLTRTSSAPAPDWTTTRLNRARATAEVWLPAVTSTDAPYRRA